MNKKNLAPVLAVVLVVILLTISFYFKLAERPVIRADAPQVATAGFLKRWFGRAVWFLGAPVYAYDAIHSLIALEGDGLDPARFGHLLLRLAQAECRQDPSLIRIDGRPLFTLIETITLPSVPIIGRSFPKEKEIMDTIEFLRNNIKQEYGVKCLVMLQILLDYEDFWRTNGNYSEQFFTNLEAYKQEVENIIKNAQVVKGKELQLLIIELDKYTNGSLKNMFDVVLGQFRPCDCNKSNPWSKDVIVYFKSYLDFLKKQLKQVETKKNFYEGILNLPEETLDRIRENIEQSVQDSPDNLYLYITYRDFYRNKDFTTVPIVNSLDSYKLIISFLDFHIGGLEERIKLVEDFIKKVELLTPAGLFEEIKDVEQSIDFLKGARDHFSSFPVTKENEKELLGRINRIIDQIEAAEAELARLKEELRCRQQQQKAWRLPSE